MIDPGEDFDERRLAGAILAEQREDFPAMHCERGALERARACKRLGETGHPKDRLNLRRADGHPSATVGYSPFQIFR